MEQAKVAKSNYFASHGDEHPPAFAIVEDLLSVKKKMSLLWYT